MNPGVGAACGVSYGPPVEEALQSPLEFALNRAAGGLTLPTDKAGAVVLECSEDGPAHLPGI